MIEHLEIELARPSDAVQIGRMSKRLIEDGLGWSWTPARVAQSIRKPERNVVVCRDGARIAGFGIMAYEEEDAHLLLFAVQPTYRRRGVGSKLLKWLEGSAVVAGIASIHLETRRANEGARRFYRAQGYRETAVVPGYYRGVESAVRMTRVLRARAPG